MSYTDRNGGQVYTATIESSVLSTNPHDLLTLLSSNSRVELLDLEFYQVTAAPLGIGIELWRGSTGSGGGSAVTPVNIKGWSGAPSAVSAVTANSSAVISTTSAVRLAAGAFEAGDGKWCFRPCVPPVLDTAQRAHIRITAPSTGGAAGVAIYGTATFRETGKPAVS